MYQLTDTDAVRRTADGAHIPTEPANRDYADYLEWLAAGNVPEPAPPPTPAALVATLVGGLQAHMDTRARALGYDDLSTAITYRGDPNPKFAAEAEGLFLLRSGAWTTAYAFLARVQAGEVPFPTLDEAIALMPPLTINYPESP